MPDPHASLRSPVPDPGKPSDQSPEQPPAPARTGSAGRRALLIGGAAVAVTGLLAAGLIAVVSQESTEAAKPAPTSTEPDWTPNPVWSQLAAERQAKEAAKNQVATTIGTALTAQATALLAGDRAAFVGLAPASQKPTVDWLNERFTSLRAMGVAQWTPTVTDARQTTGLKYQANVAVAYCFVANCARPLQVDMTTEWDLADPAKPVLTRMYGGLVGRTTLPWAWSVLDARVGDRVVVATTGAQAGRIEPVLKAAEAAAKVADTYAAGARPGRYVLYLAGDKEWDDWAYGDEGKWVAGYANENAEAVVIHLSALRTTGLDELLRHEFAHVASLAGRAPGTADRDTWWLKEGLADYAAYGDRSFSAHPRRAETAAFVRGGWNGDLRVARPGEKASARDASARYGTAYLGFACLIKSFGRDRTLAFTTAVTVRATPLDAAATASLGTPWAQVSKSCAAQIRRTAT